MLQFKPFEIVDNFRQAVLKAVDDNEHLTQLILDTYCIKSTSQRQEVVQSILKFVTDIGFYVPAICIAHSWRGKAFVYHFNEPNPWEGPFKGFATHILDIAFLLQNYTEHLSEEQQESAREMARHVIGFVNGEDPFQPYRGQKFGGARVYGPADEAGFIVSEHAEAFGRNQRIWNLADEVGLEKLSEVLQNFLSG